MQTGGRVANVVLIANGMMHGFGSVGLDSIVAGTKFSPEDSASDDEAMTGVDCGRASMGKDARQLGEELGAWRERCGEGPGPSP